MYISRRDIEQNQSAFVRGAELQTVYVFVKKCTVETENRKIFFLKHEHFFLSFIEIGNIAIQEKRSLI